MTLKIKRGADEITVKAVGRLDSFTAPVLEKTINKLACDAPSIILEMSGIEMISDAGIEILLGTHKKISEVGELKLIGARESVIEVLKNSGCADALLVG